MLNSTLRRAVALAVQALEQFKRDRGTGQAWLDAQAGPAPRTALPRLPAHACRGNLLDMSNIDGRNTTAVPPQPELPARSTICERHDAQCSRRSQEVGATLAGIEERGESKAQNLSTGA